MYVDLTIWVVMNKECKLNGDIVADLVQQCMLNHLLGFANIICNSWQWCIFAVIMNLRDSTTNNTC